MSMSEILSNRSIQPGDVQFWREPEDRGHDMLERFCESRGYNIIRKPRLNIFGNDRYAIEPDSEIFDPVTGKSIYFEIKFQGPRGNAEERLYRNYSLGIAEAYKDTYGQDWHIATVLTGHLATGDKYIVKIPIIVGSVHKNDIFFWTHENDDDLWDFMNSKAEEWF